VLELLLRAIPRARNPSFTTVKVLRAQVEHAVQREMACKLADVIVRRAAMADDGHPGRAALERDSHADVHVTGVGDPARRDRELAETEAYLTGSGRDRFRLAEPLVKSRSSPRGR
jgi:glycerol-3-phosphate dehydrogenase